MHPVSLSWDADTSLPVSLALVKAQLRIDHNELDEVIADLHLPAAVEWAEGEMHRSILAKTHYWVLSDFPRGADQSLRLPRGKTQSITSIVYAHDDTTTTLVGPSASPAGTGYRENLRGDSGGILHPPSNDTWPEVDVYAPAPVLITFSAGWTTTQIPGDIKGAIIRYIADALDAGSMHDLPQNYTPWHEMAKGAAISAWKLIRWW